MPNEAVEAVKRLTSQVKIFLPKVTICTITSKEDFEKYGKSFLNWHSNYRKVLVFTNCKPPEELYKVPNLKLGVFQEEFHFAKARNFARDLAGTEWILSLDTDEKFLPEMSDFEMLNYESIEAIRFGIINRRTKEEHCNNYQELPRLYRRHLDYKYHCHETITENIKKGIGNGWSLILHEGYISNDVIEQKARRNAFLLAKDIVEEPGNPRHYKEMKKTLQ